MTHLSETAALRNMTSGNSSMSVRGLYPHFSLVRATGTRARVRTAPTSED